MLCVSDLLADTNVAVALHRQSGESDVGGVDAQACEVDQLLELDRQVPPGHLILIIDVLLNIDRM